MTLAARMILAGALAGTGLLAHPAAAAVGDWVEIPSAKLRLVGTDRAGTVAAALEIVLEPGWKTYWRTPGEGGLKPVFDFSASRNVLAAEIGYPPPLHYDDGYTVTNVYQDRVVLPIDLTPLAADSAVALDLVVELGVCETICIPVSLAASLTIPPGATDPEALAIVEEGIAALPGTPEEGVFAVTGVTATGPGRYRATAVVPQAFGADLFVEGPPGWHPVPAREVAREGNRITFSFGFERPDGTAPPAGTAITLTLVSDGAAVEQQMALP